MTVHDTKTVLLGTLSSLLAVIIMQEIGSYCAIVFILLAYASFLGLTIYRVGRIDLFQGIDIRSLKSYLFSWVESKPYKKIIKRVILYRTACETNVPTSVKYIIYFDIAYNQKTEQTRTIHNKFLSLQIPIINDEFGSIYKENAPENFHQEWQLTDKKPIGVSDKHAVVLFSKNPLLNIFT